MADASPTLDVGTLKQRVLKSVGNIQQHRDAMASVAATVRAQQPAKPVKEVTTK